MKRLAVILALGGLIAVGLVFFLGGNLGSGAEKSPRRPTSGKLEKATFAGGCFWCMQPPYDKLKGVVSTAVGYTGGHKENPTYEEVSTGTTGHYEAVEIEFDPSRITYQELLEEFWKNIDPTNKAGQFADMGSQYRTAVFYHSEEQKRLALESKKRLGESGKFDKPIATEILPAAAFYKAEDYHQKFYIKSPFRYGSYSSASGRKGFLKKMWGED